MNNDTGQTNLMIKSVQTTPHRHATPPTGRSAQPHPTRVNQLALTIKHTVEFSNNRRTPSEPQSFSITSLPGAVPQTYQILSADQIRFRSQNWKELQPACRIRQPHQFQGTRSSSILRCGFQPRHGHPAVSGWCPSARRADLENITHVPAYAPTQPRWSAAHRVSAGQGVF
jgi:hypothetical protein